MISQYLNHTMQAANHVLGNRIKLNIEPGSLIVKSTDQPLGDVTGISSVVGEEFHLSMALAFSETVLLSVSSDFTNEIHYSIDEAVLDVASIITTMVANEIRERIAKMGFLSNIAHPFVVQGYQSQIVHPFKKPKLIFPINTDLGIVFLEMSFKVH